MQYSTIGNSTIHASKLILGTWQAGKSMWADIDDNEIHSAIRGSLDLGINMIDTAMAYGDGYAERALAIALTGINRETYYIATKILGKLTYDEVIDECEKSLQNLKTDYIDLYQIHWPAGTFNYPSVPVQETLEAFNDLKNSGKILNIGVSNFSQLQLEEALQYADIVSNQPPYSLLWRQYDKAANPFCRKNNISILAYSPLAQGILTGKIKSGHKFANGDHRSKNRLLNPAIFPKVEQVLAALQEYANKYTTSVGNIALNWLTSQANTFAIVGARNLAQVQDNIKCYDFQLTAQEITAIDELSHIVTDAMDQDIIMWDNLR